MPTLVVPFRGQDAKSRLGDLRPEARSALADAMLGDVLEACLAVGPAVVVAPPGTAVGDAVLVPDPGGGQGAAVLAGLDAAVATGGSAPYLVVNAGPDRTITADELEVAVPERTTERRAFRRITGAELEALVPSPS